MLGRWKREYELGIAQGKPVFTGRGVPALTEQEKEIKQLRKELEIARQERDILKKAVTFSPKKPTKIRVHRTTPPRVQS